jgi:hypothetical protein
LVFDETSFPALSWSLIKCNAVLHIWIIF